ncbi:polysaccharide deacetylase family protein, partial [Hydrogenivirga sp. 128-5-R1-1]|uniref:polysaccharide deacetylase family protein n=1 Tax=Hydrogenivirga sp. 128-5-R1-1 TaxID=392423 RepID=UPI00015F1F9E
LGVEIDTFCYPYGDKDEKIEEIVKNAGYKYAFTTKEGKFNGIKKQYSINRIFVEGNKLISLPDFIRKILVY